MMQALRKNTKIIIWVIVVAFVGTIIFAWGMDMTGRGGGGRGEAPAGVIGSVNERNINVRNFQAYTDNWIDNERRTNPDKEFTDSDYRQARKEAWSTFVSEFLQVDQLDKKGLILTNQELTDFMRKYPPQQAQQQIPDFQTDGRFDYSKYLAAMSDPNFKRLWIQLEAIVSPQFRLFKLQEYIGSMVRVSNLDLQNNYIRENERARVKYGLASLRSFDINEIKIDSQTIVEYYNSNQDKYQRDEQVYYSRITVAKEPSEKDLARAYEEIREIKRELDAGGVFDTIASIRTQDPSGKGNSGNLGWFPQGQMVAPFDSAVFALKSGEISDPVKTRFGYHLIKKNDEREKDGKKEADAQHILIKPQISQETFDALQTGSSSFAETANTDNYVEMAKERGFSIEPERKIARTGTLPGIGRDTDAIDWFFAASDGSFSKVYEDKDNYMIFMRSKMTPAGITPLEEVTFLIERDLKIEQQEILAIAKAEKAYQMIIGGSSFDDACKAENLEVKDSPFFARNGRISGMGQDPNFIGTAFTLSDANKYSKPIMTQAGAVIMEYLESLPANLSSFEEIRDTLRAQTIQPAQSAVWTEWFNKTRDAAEIKDYRKEYFGDQL